MRVFILVMILALKSSPSWGINRADTIMSLLSLEEKVDMLFVVTPKEDVSDSLRVGNSSYVDYAVCDTRSGVRDMQKLPFPSEQTIFALRHNTLKQNLYKDALHYFSKKDYDGIVVADSAVGLARIYIGSTSVENDEYIQVITFPCDLLSDLIANVSVDVKAQHLSKDEMSFFYEKALPSFNMWYKKAEFDISFNDILEHEVLFWKAKNSDCRQQVINAYKFGRLDESILDKRIARLLNYEVEEECVQDSTDMDGDRYVNILSAYKSSISIYQKSDVMPFRRLDTLTTSVIDLRKDTMVDFYDKASYYQPNIKQNDQSSYVQLFLCDDECVLRSNFSSNHSKINPDQGCRVIVFAGSISKSSINSIAGFDAIITMPEKMQLTWTLLAQAIYGGIDVIGKSIYERDLNRYNMYAIQSSKKRLGFTTAFDSKFNGDSIAKIDSIVYDAIKKKATPGAQLLVVKSGDIVLQKSYGFHTYKKKQKVTNNDLYDVASITKLAVTFPVVMQLYENKVLNLDATIGDYISGIDTTDKADVTINELLLHQSGLVSFIPFYNKALNRDLLKDRSLYSRHYSRLYNIRVDTRLYQNKNARFRKDVFSNKQQGAYQRQVTQNMFMNESYVDSMFNYIYTSKLSEDKAYRYSDLGYYLMQKIIEQEEMETLDSIYYKRFTELLGADKLIYKPLNSFGQHQIVPTENDLGFRRVQLDGYVHDQGAAMLGGVAAHAGLFANAGDLAKMGQMLLYEGQYGGVRFIQPKTIGKFTKTVNHGNRRGLGVDKPELMPDKNSHVSHMASQSSYGHTGFTGTIFWIDPEHDLIYIFLSNRIHPRAYDKKLIEMNVRTKIQDVIYNSLIKS